MADLKLAPVLEATQLAPMRPVLASWFGDDVDRVEVEGTRLQAPDCYWITYVYGERRLTLKVYFRGQDYVERCARLEHRPLSPAPCWRR